MIPSYSESQRIMDDCCGTPAGEKATGMILRFLSTIAAAGGGGGGGGGVGSPTEVNPIAADETAFGAVTSTYPGVGQYVDAHDKLFLEIYNYLDEPIWVSLDGSADHFYLNPNNSQKLEPGNQNKFIVDPIFFRYAGSAPTSGSIIVSAYY